jgi:hypothetical protein
MSCTSSDELHTASRTTMTRKRMSTASSTASSPEHKHRSRIPRQQRVRLALAQVLDSPGFGESGIACFVDDGCGRAKRHQRASAPAAGDPGARGSQRASACSSAATCPAYGRDARGNEAGENRSFSRTCSRALCDGQDPVHPWRRLGTFGRKNPLHVHTQVEAALGQGKRQ